VFRHIGPLEAGEVAHPDVVKERKQIGIDEVTAVDGELRVINRALGDLQSRWARAEKSTAPTPIQFRLRLARASYQIRQIEFEKIVSFDYVRIALFDSTR